MAVPYHSLHDNSEALNDFQLDHDFGYLDSQYLQSIINVQQAPIYGSNNCNNSSNFELQEPLHIPHSDQLQLLHLPELLQQQVEEEAVEHDFNTWFFHGPASNGNGQPNSKHTHLPQLQINCSTTMNNPGWALVQEKEANGTHTEQHVQQPLDMSWEEMSIMSEDKQHSINGHAHSVSSTTISAVRDFSDENHHSKPPHREMKSLSSAALQSSFGHPDMSLMSSSTTDGESERGHHRRSMSCHSVDSAVEVKFPHSLDQRMQSHFPRDSEEGLAIAKSTNVSGMLIDLESKLVASLRNKVQPPASPNRQQQQLQGGHMINQLVMSWEDSRTSESTVMTSSTPSSNGRQRLRDSQSSESLGGAPLPATSTVTPHLHTHGQQPFNQEEPGIRLVNLLVGCADSVANKNFVHANSLLRELSVMVSPYGDTIQRVASYFTYGLAAHIAGTGSGQNLYRALGIKEPSATDTFEAFQVFCEVCPFIKFGEAASTQAVLEAFSGEENVHLIDLGMVQGTQWLRLLQGLATRNGGPPKIVRLTGVQVKPNPRSSKSLNNDDQHGKQLKEFAEKLHLNFSCQLISVERLEQIQAWMLTSQQGQAIAVNCSAKMHTLLYQDHEMCINYVLSIVLSLRPKLFSLLEQEANHNVPHFLPRFLEALHFYSAMFDSLDATLSRISPERAKVEQLWLGQEIINILACEGRDRVERHERLQQWRGRMAKAGFKSLPLSDLAVLQVKTFPSISYGTGFTVLENRGSLILSWQDRPLFSCSMWTC